MAPPTWLRVLGDQLKPLGEQLKPLGDKLKAETSSLVELLKTPTTVPQNASQYDHVTSPTPATVGEVAGDGSSLLNGLFQILAVTVFLGMVGVAASVIVMEDQTMQSSLSRVASKAYTRLLCLMNDGLAIAAAPTRDDAPAPAKDKSAMSDAASTAPAAEPLAKTKLAESYVEVENDTADFELIGAAKWHERSFVSQ